MSNIPNSSEDSHRIARNTAFLYFRMLLLLFVGLFTSRVVLAALGTSDYGIYGAVAGVITVLGVVTTALSAAITRFITCEIGKGDAAKLKKVFSTSLMIQVGFCVLVLILTETLGLWFLNRRMTIPEGRLGAANWVLQCSMGVMMASILSVPFNAVLMAREKMQAFALISILEAVLKLAVAIVLDVFGGDKLKLYAVLMLAVAVLVRLTYGWYCKRHFEESRAKLAFYPDLVKEMSVFAGWNLLGSGSLVINTAGVNLLSNVFFGVVVNAARQVALQVDGIVKQFVTNVVVAINPQITKSYVSGNRQRAYDLVRKGSKYASLIILLCAIPIWFEADFLLRLWLGDAPEGAALFTRLTLGGLLLELLCTTFSTLILAHGDIRRFYLAFSSVSLLIFPAVWLAFSLGAPAYIAYVVFMGLYVAVDITKLLILNAKTGFPIGRFVSAVLVPVLTVGTISTAMTFLVWRTLPEGWARLLLVLLTSTVSIAASTLAFGLSADEKQFLRNKGLRFLRQDEKTDK